MSIFGMSSQGKQARNNLAYDANWLNDISKNAQGNSGNAETLGNNYSNQFLNALNAAYKNGFGTPGQVLSSGMSLNPNLLLNEKQMLNRIQGGANAYNNLPALSDTTNATNALYGANTQGAQDTANTELGTAAQGAGNRYDINNSAYQQMMNRVNPENSLMQEAAARSFAPAEAQANQQIRSMGLAADSPEATQLLNQVKSNQGAAMDQAAMQGITQQNQLQQQQNLENQNILQNLTGQQLNTQAQGYANTAAARQAQAYNDLASRNLQTQDALNRLGIAGTVNQQNMSNVGLTSKAAQQGMGYQGANVGQRNFATQGYGNAAGQQYGNALGFGQEAQNAALGSAGINQNIYNNESGNANWGGKMLMGAATSWLSNPMNSFTGGGGGGMSGLFNQNSSLYSPGAPSGSLNGAFGY